MTSYGTMSTVLVSEQSSEGNGTTSTEDPPGRFLVIYAISDILPQVFIPFILLLGTFGNVMTVLVIRAVRSQFGDPSMCVYFPCLAMCDQTVLTLGLGRRWIIAMFMYDVRNLHVVVCKLNKFMVYAASRIAAWILVAMTSQRVLAVMWPLHQRMSVTKSRAKAVVLVIVLFCCLVDSGIIVVYNVQKINGTTNCKPLKDSPQAAFYQDKVVPWLNSITGSWLPFVILVVNNCVLVYKVRLSAKASRHITDNRRADARTKQVTQLSITLIVTSLVFILLTSSIPATFLIRKIYHSSPSSNHKLKADLVLVTTVFDLLLYCNSAVNFYLYFLTGPTFSHEVRRLLYREGKRGMHSHSPTQTGTIMMNRRPGRSLSSKVASVSQPESRSTSTLSKKSFAQCQP